MPVTDAALTSLLREVADTETALAAEGDEQARRIRSRLSDSVARPLRQAAGTVAGGEEPEGGERHRLASGSGHDVASARRWHVPIGANSYAGYRCSTDLAAARGC